MKSASSYQLRIIDANLNRVGEGLRVLEEFARLSLNDVVLTGKLKNLRHKILHIDDKLQQRLIGARDAAGDVGAGMAVAGEEKGRDPVATIVANARRVQESLRVLEEIAKEPVLGLPSPNYEKARFEVYTIEKELISSMLRHDKLKRLTGLYVIVDTEFLKGRSYLDVVGAAIKGGAKIIQLRDKTDNIRDFYTAATRIKELCAEQNVLFIVNDSLEVALAADADGLHVGQDDLPVVEARGLLPVDKILGASARTVAEAGAARVAGADYLGVGSMFATSTKPDTTVVGPQRIKEIKKSVDLPVVAIGGINNDNINDVMKAGADAAAVISAVMGAADIEQATRELVAIIEREKRGQSG
jgi:thiamine-phosphate pyrophosphorylase